LIDLSLHKSGESYAGTPGLAELARYGHFTSPDRLWEGIEL